MSNSDSSGITPALNFWGSTGTEPEVGLQLIPSINDGIVYVDAYLWQGAIGSGNLLVNANISYTKAQSPFTQTLSDLGVKAVITYHYDEIMSTIWMSAVLSGDYGEYTIKAPIGTTNNSQPSFDFNSWNSFHAKQVVISDNEMKINFYFGYDTAGGEKPYGITVNPDANLGEDGINFNLDPDQPAQINQTLRGYSMVGTVTAKDNYILFDGTISKEGTGTLGFQNSVLTLNTGYGGPKQSPPPQ